MTREIEDLSKKEIATERLNDFLKPLLEQGLTQGQIAMRVGVPPQYFSDIKRGERPVTELIARRLGEEFNFDYRWLMGTINSMDNSTTKSNAGTTGDTIWLPLFPFPIHGEPRQNSHWNGTCVELAGLAAGRVGLATFPYVLQFGKNDIEGRLHLGDLILISQAPNANAEIHVISHRKKLFLARATKDGGWNRVADGEELPSDGPVNGHCMGIVWSALV